MCRILQKFFLFGLAIVAAVNADVSQLFNNGYNYPQPAPTFQDQQSLPIEAPATPPAPVPTQAPVKVRKRKIVIFVATPKHILSKKVKSFS